MLNFVIPFNRWRSSCSADALVIARLRGVYGSRAFADLDCVRTSCIDAKRGTEGAAA